MKVKLRATTEFGGGGRRYKRGEVFAVDRQVAKALKLMGKAVDYHETEGSQTYQTRALKAEQPEAETPKPEAPQAQDSDEEEKASMSMSKPALMDMARTLGVEVETDDNKADLVEKINRYRRRDMRAE
jgi:hypothetical protein